MVYRRASQERVGGEASRNNNQQEEKKGKIYGAERKKKTTMQKTWNTLQSEGESCKSKKKKDVIPISQFLPHSSRNVKRMQKGGRGNELKR